MCYFIHVIDEKSLYEIAEKNTFCDNFSVIYLKQ